MLSVNYNPSVLKAQNNLTNAASAMTKALERMSTGFKINSAKDDAAGMFVATKLTTQIRGILQARNNANDGISYISTASESLTGMGKILNRIRDLAVQGANGVYNTSSRDAMQSEADELTKELYRIKNSTIFNGQSIFGEAETSGISAISTLSAPRSSKAVSTAGLAKVASVDEVPAGYTAIYTAEDLDNVRNNLSGKYILMNDIDLSEYANWDPIGDAANYFKGIFDGNGHVIKNMKIDRESEDYVGLFGRTNRATIKNVGLENIDVKGKDNAGGLVGCNWSSSTITNSYAQGNISGSTNTGGLVGYNLSASSITNSYAHANVTGFSRIGGLVGWNHSYSTITNSFADGNISGNSNLGGLVGVNEYFAAITNSYAQGTASGTAQIGGFVGYNLTSSSINNSYAQANVSGTNSTGGFVGFNNANTTITGSIWDKQKSGLDVGIGLNQQTDPAKVSVTGLTTSEMANPQNFVNAGWDASVWDLTSSPPKLAWQPKEVKGNLRLQIGADGDESSVIHADTAFEIGAFAVDFSDEEASRASIDTVDELLEKINKKVSEFGAVLNRLDSVLTSQTTSIENLTAARSTIQDADIAEESAIFVRNQILQRTTSSLLVQAQRSSSSLIMNLIRQ